MEADFGSLDFCYLLPSPSTPSSATKVRLGSIERGFESLPRTLFLTIRGPSPTMRLLKYNDDGDFSLTNFFESDIPKYAILSHTWGQDSEEVTFADIMNKTGENKLGFEKIKFCGEQAKRDGLLYFWVDTCCINKENNAELSRSINSMFRWYRNASRCYVYLSDVPRPIIDINNYSPQSWESDFRRSRWFTRGWAL